MDSTEKCKYVDCDKGF